MSNIITGFVSGAISGIIMGLISHLLFRLKLFRSSLIVIDGTFLFRTLKRQPRSSFVVATGLCIHLVTSGVFGAVYFMAGALMGIHGTAATSLTLTGLYIALLWLSMLFIALPVAGEGFLGKKSGPYSWLEQLILHMIFWVFFYGCISVFL
jgi:hypothetical protein